MSASPEEELDILRYVVDACVAWQDAYAPVFAAEFLGKQPEKADLIRSVDAAAKKDKAIHCYKQWLAAQCASVVGDLGGAL